MTDVVAAAVSVPPPLFVPFSDALAPFVVTVKYALLGWATTTYASTVESAGETIANFLALLAALFCVYMAGTLTVMASIVIGLTCGFLAAPFQIFMEQTTRAWDAMAQRASKRHAAVNPLI